MLICLGHYLVQSHSLSLPSNYSEQTISNIHQALNVTPNSSTDCVLHVIALETARMLTSEKNFEFRKLVFKNLPVISLVKAVMQLAWSTATGCKITLSESSEAIHRMILDGTSNSISDVYAVCKLALETFTVMFILSPNILEYMMKDESWQTFVIDLLLIVNERYLVTLYCFRSQANICCLILIYFQVN